MSFDLVEAQRHRAGVALQVAAGARGGEGGVAEGHRAGLGLVDVDRQPAQIDVGRAVEARRAGGQANQLVAPGGDLGELGDLEGIRALKDANIPVLKALVDQGCDLVAPVPSCVLMFKQELPLLFKDDPDVQRVADAMYDPFQYLMLRHRAGRLRTDFVRPLGKVAYHIPCHHRVQNIGQKTRETLQLVPDTQVTTIERCAGHDGTWGVKKDYFEHSMKIGRPVFRQMAQAEPDFISSDCPIAARHIQQGIRDGGTQLDAVKAHPLTLLRMAYGLEES